MHSTNNCPNQKSMLLAQKQSLKISCDNNIISKSILLDILHIRISYCLLVLRNLCRLWRLLLWYSFFFARPYLSLFCFVVVICYPVSFFAIEKTRRDIFCSAIRPIDLVADTRRIRSAFGGIPHKIAR